MDGSQDEEPARGPESQAAEIDGAVTKTKQPKLHATGRSSSAKGLTTSKDMKDLPVELLLEVLKSLPDLRTLQSFILSCKHYHAVFATKKDVIVTAVLCNDIGKHVMIDYLEIDSLIVVDQLSMHRMKQFQFEIEEAIERRKETIIPEVLPRATIAYIATQAGLVRQSPKHLVDNVLFAVPNYGALHVKEFHMDMAHQHYERNKKYKGFDEFVCKMPLDDQEERRFVRGLHRLHICRILSTNGWATRLGGHCNPCIPPTAHQKRVLMNSQAFSHQVAKAAKTDQLSNFADPQSMTSEPLQVFLRTLPPWHKEEVAACAKLFVRGLAYNDNRPGNRRDREDYFEMVLLHFSTLLGTRTLPAIETRQEQGLFAWLRGDRRLKRHPLALFDELIPRVTHSLRGDQYTYRHRSLCPHLMEVSVPCLEHWTYPGKGREFDESPYEDAFEDAPPLYRAMVHLVKAPEWKVESNATPLDANRFVDGCWAMWSNPRRLKALPQWKQLTAFLENDVLKDTEAEEAEMGTESE